MASARRSARQTTASSRNLTPQRRAGGRDRDHRRGSRDADELVYTSDVPLADECGQAGQQREAIVEPTSTCSTSPDLFWTQTRRGAPSRPVTVTLSGPFTYPRADARDASSNVMVGAAVVALVVVVIAVGAHRRAADQPDPAADARRAGAAGGPPRRARAREAARIAGVAELADAFNAMAERLQESIDFISARPRPQPRLPGRCVPRAAHPDRGAADLQRAAARGSRRRTRRRATSSSSRAASRSSGSTGWPPTCSSCPSSIRAWSLLDLRPDDLRAVVENAVQQAQPVAERKGMTS